MKRTPAASRKTSDSTLQPVSSEHQHQLLSLSSSSSAAVQQPSSPKDAGGNSAPIVAFFDAPEATPSAVAAAAAIRTSPSPSPVLDQDEVALAARGRSDSFATFEGSTMSGAHDQGPIVESLTSDDVRCVTELYEAYRLEASVPGAVWRLAHEISKGSATEEVVAAQLQEAGHRDGYVIDFSTLLRFAAIAKVHRKLISEEEQETIDAFVRLGGNADCSGDINANTLRSVVFDFGLTVDIDSLIREVDEDNSGKIDFEEFTQFYKGLRQRGRRRDLLTASDFEAGKVGEASIGLYHQREVFTRKRSITVGPTDKPVKFMQGAQKLSVMMQQVEKHHLKRIGDVVAMGHEDLSLPKRFVVRPPQQPVGDTSTGEKKKRIDNELSPALERVLLMNRDDRKHGRKSTTKELIRQIAAAETESVAAPQTPTTTRPSTAIVTSRQEQHEPQMRERSGISPRNISPRPPLDTSRVSQLLREERRLAAELAEQEQRLAKRMAEVEAEAHRLSEAHRQQREIQERIRVERLKLSPSAAHPNQDAGQTSTQEPRHHRRTRESAAKYSLLQKPQRPQTEHSQQQHRQQQSENTSPPAECRQNDADESVSTFSDASTPPPASSRAGTEQQPAEQPAPPECSYSDDDFVEIDPEDLRDDDGDDGGRGAAKDQGARSVSRTPSSPSSNSSGGASGESRFELSDAKPAAPAAQPDVVMEAAPASEREADEAAVALTASRRLELESPAAAAPLQTGKKPAPPKQAPTPDPQQRVARQRAKFFSDRSRFTLPFRHVTAPAASVRTPRQLADKLKSLNPYAARSATADEFDQWLQ